MPECIKDDNAVNGKAGNSTPDPSKTPDRPLKFAWVITSGTLPLCKISDTIQLPPFATQICENAHQVTQLVVLPSAYSRDSCTDFYGQ